MDSGWNIVHHGKGVPVTQLSREEKRKIESGVIDKPSTKSKSGRKKTTSSNGVSSGDVKPGVTSATTLAPSWDKDRDIEQIDFSRAVESSKSGKKVSNAATAASSASQEKNKESLLQLSVTDFQQALLRCQMRFPGMPATWLVEVGAYLNTFFTPGDQDNREPVKQVLLQAREAPNYPSCLLNEPTRKLLRQVVCEQKREVVMEYLRAVLPLVLRDITRNQVILGHEIVSQLVLWHSPPALLATSDMFGAFLNDSRSHAHRFCVVYWYLLQATSAGDLTTSWRVFMDLLLPHIATKTYAELIVSYLEIASKSCKKTSACLTTRDVTVLLDLLSQPGSITNPILERLRKLFNSLVKDIGPMIRRVAINSPGDIQEFFVNLLGRLPHANQWSRNVILDCLLHCFLYNSSCWDKWASLLESRQRPELFVSTLELLGHLTPHAAAVQRSPGGKKAMQMCCRRIQRVCDKALESGSKTSELPSRDVVAATKAKAIALMNSCSSWSCSVFTWCRQLVFLALCVGFLTVAVEWWLVVGYQNVALFKEGAARQRPFIVPQVNDWNKLKSVRWLVGLPVWSQLALRAQEVQPYVMKVVTPMRKNWAHLWEKWVQPAWKDMSVWLGPSCEAGMKLMAQISEKALRVASEASHTGLEWTLTASHRLYQWLLHVEAATDASRYMSKTVETCHYIFMQISATVQRYIA